MSLDKTPPCVAHAAPGRLIVDRYQRCFHRLSQPRVLRPCDAETCRIGTLRIISVRRRYGETMLTDGKCVMVPLSLRGSSSPPTILTVCRPQRILLVAQIYIAVRQRFFANTTPQSTYHCSGPATTVRAVTGIAIRLI